MEPLLAAYSKNNPGFSFEDPAQAIRFLQWVVGYVDDNSLILTFRDEQSTQEALAEAQKALASWKKFLQLTGDDLALEKCVYSYMGWKKKKGKEVLSSIKEQPGTITINDNKHTTTKIRRIEAWDAERILGVRCALDGQDTVEFSYRLEEAKN